MTWRHQAKNSGAVTVDIARLQAVIGFVGDGKSAAANLAINVTPQFCAVTLSSLDGQPISRSGKMLPTATARIANSGMEWNAKRTSLTKWGTAPTLIEPVTGKVVLKNLSGARSVMAQPLDGAGRPYGAPIPCMRTAGGWMLEIGEPPTTWFVVSVTH